MLITPYDLLLPEGEEATLEVEAERRWLTFVDPPRPGVQVEVEGVGLASTGPDGFARFKLGVLPAGTHRPVIRVGSRRLDAIVRVIPRETPLIVVDIDQTIADVTPQGFIFRRVKNVRPFVGSREALEEISETMQVIYLTARDHIFTRKTKLWLRVAEFPEGPVYLRRGTRFWTHSPREHKIERLAELRPKFPNIKWGIGDKPGDVAAYAAHAIRPILIAPSRPPEVAAEVHCAQDWKAVREIIRKG